MTLLEAFREIGPPDGSVADSRRVEATEIIFAELLRLKPVLRDGSDLADDAVQVAVVNMIRTGPRGTRNGDPDTDEGVTKYLVVVLKHAYWRLGRSIRRGGFHGAEIKPEDLTVDGETEIGQGIDQTWARSLLEWARRELFAVIVPAVAETLEAAESQGFLESVSALRSIVDHETTLEDYVRGKFGSATDRQMQTVRTRFRRAKEKIAFWITECSPDTGYSNEQLEAIRGELADLSLKRQTSAPQL